MARTTTTAEPTEVGKGYASYTADPATVLTRTDSQPAEGAYDRLELKRIQLLYASSQTAVFAALPALAILIPLLWDHSNRLGLMLWTAAVLLVNLFRLLHLRQINTATNSAQKIARLRAYYLAWNTMSGMAWGSGMLLAFPDTMAHQMFLVFVLGGITAAAVAIHAAMLEAIYAFVVPIVLPLILRLGLSDGELHYQMSLVSALFIGVLLYSAARMRTAVTRTLELSILNEDLINNLRAAKDDTERLNQNLTLENHERRAAEEQLRTERDFIAGILETECALVMVMDADGYIVRFNRACEAATGYRADELVGRSIWETLVYAPGAGPLQRKLAAVLAGQGPEHCECQWIAKDGRLLSVQLSSNAILDSTGLATHVVATGVDTTARRAIEMELERTRQDFQLLVEGVTGYAIYMLDPEGRVTSWNAGAERITGYSSTEVIGSHFSCFYRSEDVQRGQPYFQLFMAISEDRHEYEGWCLRRDGSRYWATVAISPLRDNLGRLRGFSVITGDLSSRKETEDTIRALLEISEQLNLTLDIDVLMRTLLRQSMKLIDAESGHVALVRDGNLIIHEQIKDQGHRPPLTQVKPQLSALAQRVLESGHPGRVNVGASAGGIGVFGEGPTQIRSALCCPILDYSGHVLGYIELHNRCHSANFSNSDEERLASVAQTAALAVQNAFAYQKTKRAEQLLSAETHILELIASGSPQDDILHALLVNLEQHLQDTRSLLIQMDADGNCLPYAVTPSGRIECARANRAAPIPPFPAFPEANQLKGLRTSVYDISDHQQWRDWLAVQDLETMRTRWICPVRSRDERLLGLLLICRSERSPLAREPRMIIENAAHLAGIAIERRRADERLRLHERAIESSLNAILVIGSDPERRPIIYANPATSRITGYAIEALSGKDWLSLYDPLDDSDLQSLQQLQQALDAEHEANAIVQGVHRNGQRFWADVFVAPVRAESGRVTHFVAVMHDISDRVEAERALRESETKFKAITANIPGMVYQLILHADGNIRFSYASDGSLEVCGLPPEDIIADAEAFCARLSDSDNTRFRQSMVEAARKQSTWLWEAHLQAGADDSRWISARSSPRTLDSGDTLFDGIMFNVTERKLADIELKHSQAQLRALSIHLQRVREDEKAHIARELHDELGSTLTALKIDAAWMKRHLPADLETLTQKCKTVLELLDSALLTTKRISSNLRPPILDDLGLVAAIEWQVREFKSRMGIPCDLRVSGEADHLDDDQSIALFRIFQEAMTNIVRHAQARHVKVSVSITLEEALIQIQDDGRGMDITADQGQGSHGLYGMHERAISLGGELRVESRPGQGTSLTVHIPLYPDTRQTIAS